MNELLEYYESVKQSKTGSERNFVEENTQSIIMSQIEKLNRLKTNSDHRDEVLELARQRRESILADRIQKAEDYLHYWDVYRNTKVELTKRCIEVLKVQSRLRNLIATIVAQKYISKLKNKFLRAKEMKRK